MRIGSIVFSTVTGIAVTVIVALFIYVFAVAIPRDKDYCRSRGFEYITIDHSWACKDPQTGQLYR